jgi:hypothetical protein
VPLVLLLFMAPSRTEEGKVEGDVGGRLCCDAGGDAVWTEAGVCAHRAEDEGFSAAVQYPVGGWKDGAYGGPGGSGAPVRWRRVAGM